MTIDFTEAEVKALAELLEPFNDTHVVLMSAWLKLVRAQAQELAGPSAAATASMSAHSPPAVGPADSVPAPIPGVTRMGAGTLSFDTWGLR